jgi:hypothetical protein
VYQHSSTYAPRSLPPPWAYTLPAIAPTNWSHPPHASRQFQRLVYIVVYIPVYIPASNVASASIPWLSVLVRCVRCQASVPRFLAAIDPLMKRQRTAWFVFPVAVPFLLSGHRISVSPRVAKGRPMLPQFVPVTHHVPHQHGEATQWSSEEHGPAIAECAPLLGDPAQPRSGSACYDVHRRHSGQAIPALPSPLDPCQYFGQSSVAGKWQGLLPSSRVQGLPLRHAYPATASISRSRTTCCPIPASPATANRDRRGPVVPPSMYARCTQGRYWPNSASRARHDRFGLIPGSGSDSQATPNVDR